MPYRYLVYSPVCSRTECTRVTTDNRCARDGISSPSLRNRSIRSFCRGSIGEQSFFVAEQRTRNLTCKQQFSRLRFTVIIRIIFLRWAVSASVAPAPTAASVTSRDRFKYNLFFENEGFQQLEGCTV